MLRIRGKPGPCFGRREWGPTSSGGKDPGERVSRNGRKKGAGQRIDFLVGHCMELAPYLLGHGKLWKDTKAEDGVIKLELSREKTADSLGICR